MEHALKAAPIRRREILAVAALIGVAWLIRVLIGTRVPAPSVYIDELVHAELARNLLDGKWFTVRGARVSVSFVYPILIAPAWLLHSTEQAYAVAKAIGAFVMVSSSVPVYIWSRRMMTHRFALLAVALALLVPAFSLTGALMLETAFLPIFVLALFALAVTLEHPSIRNQALTLLAVVAASLTRFEGLILVPIIVTGIAVYWAATRCRLRPFTPIVLTIGCVSAAYLVWRLSVEKTIIPSSGVYEGFVQAHYTVTSVVSWFHANAAALIFATALVPCFALAVMSLEVLRRRERDSAVCAYVVVTVAATTWLLAFASFSANWEPLGLKERYTFYVDPVVLMALPLWLCRGAFRTRLASSLIAFALTALVVTLPLQRILSAPALLQSYSFLGLNSWVSARGTSETLTLVSVCAAALAAAAVIAPRSIIVWALPAAVATALTVNSWYAVASLSDRARGTDELSGLRSAHQFIDDAVSSDAHVYYLNTTTYQVESSRGHFWETWAPIWAAEFWNRSLRGTLSFGLDEASPLEQGTAALDWASGRIGAASPGPWDDSLALTDPRFHLVGTELRRQGPFVLTRFRKPLRLRSAVEGVDGSGYMFSGAAYDVYAARSRRAGVTLQSRYPLDVTFQSGTLALEGSTPTLGKTIYAKQVHIAGGPSRSFSIPVPPAPYRVEVHSSGAPAKIDFDGG